MEVIVLGLISAARPATSQAAVFALLRAPGAARTLLAFAVAGFVVSVLVGSIILGALDGAGGHFGHSRVAAAFDVLAGVAAIGFAAGVRRTASTPRRERPPGRAASAIAVRLRHPSLSTAAAAGVATHVPGLIYVVALNSIAAADSGAVASLTLVAVYNVLWFALPIGALVLVHRSPAAATAFLDRLTAWARRHQERLLVALFGLLGLYLTTKGVLELT